MSDKSFSAPTVLPRVGSSLKRARSFKAFRLFFRMNGLRRMPFPLDALQSAIDLHYLDWPLHLHRWIRGARVADVGCGNSLHGIGFLFAGAKSYVGLDPGLAKRQGKLKNIKEVHGEFVESDLARDLLQNVVPGIQYRAACLHEACDLAPFDVIVMHNVTEHLPDVDDVFYEARRQLSPGGLLIFSHPNFYAWSGHHMKPRTLEEIRPGDPEQAPFVDWGHLTERADWPAKVRLHQNRLRTADLFRITGKYFRIECWNEHLSNEKYGGKRLTPEIEVANPGFSRQDFLVKFTICIAQKRNAE